AVAAFHVLFLCFAAYRDSQMRKQGWWKEEYFLTRDAAHAQALKIKLHVRFRALLCSAAAAIRAQEGVSWLSKMMGVQCVRTAAADRLYLTEIDVQFMLLHMHKAGSLGAWLFGFLGCGLAASGPPAFWRAGRPRTVHRSYAEVELLSHLAVLLMPEEPIGELFRDFPVEPSEEWGARWLCPDIAAHGVLQKASAVLFVEYDGHPHHHTTDGRQTDERKTRALLKHAPSKYARKVLLTSSVEDKKARMHAFLKGELEFSNFSIETLAHKFPGIWGTSIQDNLKPTVAWLEDVGLSRAQVAKVIAVCPAVLGLSIEGNLKPTDFTDGQVCNMIVQLPAMLGYSYSRLRHRLQVLRKSNSLAKLVSVMTLTDKRFAARFPEPMFGDP
ncbi:MTERF5, partial [Symbiodinium pilosum]